MSNGETRERAVFYRPPLLAQVRVSQSGGVFDFRCAVVHLKSTDPDLEDKGNALRLAAADALRRWIESDVRDSGEHDYLILGDMNAETAQQGLGGFGDRLETLSVGMQDRYGREEALTRVASRRFLDHIVVTSDAKTAMPAEDIGEQLVIRSDTRIADWIEDYSDHVPVAVRFILRRPE